MPKILLQIEIKLDAISDLNSSMSQSDAEEEARTTFHRYIEDVKAFKFRCLVIMYTTGFILWSSVTCLDLYFAANYYSNAIDRKLVRYTTASVEQLITVVIFSIALYRLLRTMRKTGMVNIKTRMLTVHLVILILMFTISLVSAIAVIQLVDDESLNKWYI